MLPVKRWMLNIFTGLSLLLCVAVVGLWVRSYFISDTLERATTVSIYHLYAENGRLHCHRSWFGGRPMFSSGWVRIQHDKPRNADWLRDMIEIRGHRAPGTLYWSVPLWFVGVTVGVVPGFRLVWRRRRLRAPAFQVERSPADAAQA